MSEGTKDRTEGALDEAKGRGKGAWGDLTGDDSKRAEGELDKTSGNAKQGMGDVKDKVGDAKDKVGDTVRNLTGDN